MQTVKCTYCQLISISHAQECKSGSVVEYNTDTNSVLVLYTNEEEKWHKVDFVFDATDEDTVSIDVEWEGTFDGNSMNFKVISVARDEAESSVGTEYGDEFPVIPPPLPASRLPRLITDNEVSCIV